MKIDTLDVLLQTELKDIYDFEKRLVRALPKMVKAASSGELRQAFQDHLEVTKVHVERLEQVFELLGIAAKAKPCAGMKGILEEGEETIAQEGAAVLKDAALIGAAQRVEHYEIAAYGTARTFAQSLGNQEAADLLQETLEEEKEADEKLTGISERLLEGIAEGKPDAAADQGTSSRKTAAAMRSSKA